MPSSVWFFILRHIKWANFIVLNRLRSSNDLFFSFFFKMDNSQRFFFVCSQMREIVYLWFVSWCFMQKQMSPTFYRTHISHSYMLILFQFINTYKSIKQFCATTFNWICRYSGIRFNLTGNLRKNGFYLRLLEIRNHQNINIYLTPRRQFCSWKL